MPDDAAVRTSRKSSFYHLGAKIEKQSRDACLRWALRGGGTKFDPRHPEYFIHTVKHGGGSIMLNAIFGLLLLWLMPSLPCHWLGGWSPSDCCLFITLSWCRFWRCFPLTYCGTFQENNVLISYIINAHEWSPFNQLCDLWWQNVLQTIMMVSFASVSWFILGRCSDT